jgi:pimeloyl-ACP methyl ester carboxylesterase
MTASSDRQIALFTAGDGIRIAYAESGSGPLVVFVHATGFCKELCDPIIDDIRALGIEFRAAALDQRAHGDSGVPPLPFDWWDIGRDIVELVDGRRPVIGVGHSAGGAALVLAELINPGMFASLVLVEPIILPPPYVRYPDNRMSERALRRKPGFTSRQAAFDNFASKRAFAGWEDRAIWSYVNGGMRDGDGGVVLKCTPESEAEFFYSATTHGAWDRLEEVEVPSILVAGEHSATHQAPFLAELTGRFSDARYEIIPGASHFVWMEQPGVIARYVEKAISRSADSAVNKPGDN